MSNKTSMYLEGEEKFGFFLSLFYLIATKIPYLGEIYKFASMDIANIKGAKSVLDVGCGSGDMLIALRRLKYSGALFGIDPSIHMINISKLRSKGLNIDFAIGSSRIVPFKRKFDVIVSSLSFHHWKEKERSLRYLKSLLNGNGTIRIYEFEKNYVQRKWFRGVSSHAISEKEIRYYAKASGLRIVELKRHKGIIRASLA